MNSVGVWLVAGMIAVCGAPGHAQTKPAVPATQDTAALLAARGKDAPVRRETLSGIDLFPESKTKDVFLLSFQQDMAEAGVLEVTNYAGKVLYTKPIPAGDHTLAPPMPLGKLKTGTYLVEVKTPTTVYWKKVRVRLR